MAKPLPHELMPGSVQGYVPLTPCSKCGARRTGYTGARAPAPDDISVCYSCGHAAILAEDMSSTDLDLSTLDAETRAEVEIMQSLVSSRHRES